MKYPLCRQIRTNGLQCKSPALSGAAHCFYHTRLHQKHHRFLAPEQTVAIPEPAVPISFGPLDDAESVQLAISQVINGLATGQLECKLAGKLLYGLQTASRNLARLARHIPASQVIRSVDPAEGHDLAQEPAFFDDWQDDPEEAAGAPTS